DAAIEKYSFFDKIENMMQHDIQWDLEKDLKMLAKKYQEIVASKKEMILISMREEGRFPELDDAISRLPLSYRDTISNYFTEMILISMREEGRFPELDDAISRLPLSYRDTISNYFTEMMKKEKMKTIDADVAATNFLFINFGYFFLKDRLISQEEHFSVDDFTDTHIDLFIKSLQ